MWFLVPLCYQRGFARCISSGLRVKFLGLFVQSLKEENWSLEPHNPPPLPVPGQPWCEVMEGVRAGHVASSKMSLQMTFPAKQVGVVILVHCKWFSFFWPLSPLCLQETGSLEESTDESEVRWSLHVFTYLGVILSLWPTKSGIPRDWKMSAVKQILKE